MTPDDLRSFLAAYESGSIQKAAGRLNLSQPTLSRRLRRFEDVLGVALFERSPSGLAPTVYGHAFAQRARMIMTEMELAGRELLRIRDAVGGFVAFGVSPGVAVSLLPVAKRLLDATSPDLRLTVVEDVSEGLIEQVRERRIEFAVCTAPLHPDADLLVERLGEDPFVVAASERHPLAGRGPVPLAETLDYPWAMPTFRGAVRQWLESRFVGAGLAPPAARIETSSMLFLKPLLADARHLSYLPARLAEADYPGVVAIPCAPSMVLTRTIASVRLAHREPGPAAELVAATLAGAAGRLPAVRLAGLDERAEASRQA
ncbi:transcriptional regulator, LysR family [Tistlia consotensis]|uniref:Transcriptional regulator, LysR family n=1 Tax=Tistlia consotensis USBA 355 TaxID=560819 RepID=A0A1Y6B6C8_9PROT|nr:LysR family transcriptional regulator [Tistlia consotensis]SME90365.1 transcriptional regulator, LysR family [Tistlia consotensis USBA 355]SNR26663.1 transcriptional regulator, LysR family [Tistlia consotensis]